jgi:hypothetical protein
MEAKPTRLQLSRSPGFNLRAASIATNGLLPVNVARPSKWGNKVARVQALSSGDVAVAAFRAWLEHEAPDHWKREAQLALRGRNLACWCRLDAPCHADVLLAFVNAQETATDVAEPRFSCSSSG